MISTSASSARRVWTQLVLLACLLCGCGERSAADAADPEAQAGGAREEAIASKASAEPSAPITPGRRRMGDALSLADPALLTLEKDLENVRSLDLALSRNDTATRLELHAEPLPEPPPTPKASATPKNQLGSATAGGTGGDAATSAPLQPPAPPPEPLCERLDLLAIAQQLPNLRELRVSGCALELSADLGAFASKLERLELADVTIDAPLLARIAQLDQLKSLAFTRVRAPAEGLIGLGSNLKEVERLELRELETDSLVGDLLGDLHSLQEARLEGMWAGNRAMKSLGQAKKLRRLELIETRVTNFSLNELKPLKELREVHWEGSSFNDLSPLYLKELPIERFRCSCPSFGDAGVRHLRYLLGLRSIDLQVSRIATGDFASLSGLERLEELRISGRDIGAAGMEGLAKLPALRVLHLSDFTPAAPEMPHLGEIVGLRELDLLVPTFGDAGAIQLATLAQLEKLNLSKTRISDVGLASLAGLERLTELRLDGTRVTNRGLAHVAKLTQLELLHLHGTEVVDAGVLHLKTLTRLRELTLDNTLITDAGVVALKPLVRLERLGLANTVVTSKGVAALAALPKLVHVDLTGTKAQPGNASAPALDLH